VHPAQTYPYFCKVVLGTNWQTLRFHHAFLEEEMRGGIDGVASSLQNITVASSLFLGISFVVLLEGDTLASRTAAAMVATMFVIMSICGFWFSVLLSTMIVIALNQMDTSEEATVYLMRLSSLIGVPFTLLNYSGFVLFAGIFLWMWDAKVGGGGTELSAEDLGPWFAAFIVEFVLFGVVGTLPINARVIYTLYAVKQERAIEQTAMFAQSAEQNEPGSDRDLVVLPEAMLAELEAFLHVCGVEHAALPDFIRWLLVRLGPDGTSRAGGKRLAPTTRRRTELLFNREIDRRLEADLASIRACRYREPRLPPRVPDERTAEGPPGASQSASESG